MSSPHVSQYSSNSLSSCTIKQWLALFTGFRSVDVDLSGVTGTFSSLLAESSRISRRLLMWNADWRPVTPLAGMSVACRQVGQVRESFPCWSRTPSGTRHWRQKTWKHWGQCRCPDKINEHFTTSLVFARMCRLFMTW